MACVHPPGHVPRNAFTGETFGGTVTLDAAMIRSFAAAVADFNPLHHDEDVAKRSRFGRLTASGTHSASLLMALTATHYSQHAQPLGLNFSLKFRKAVREGDRLTMRWTVTRIEWKPSLNGELVSLEGESVNQFGEVALSATALLLITDKQ
jgi:acyl dehydratase